MGLRDKNLPAHAIKKGNSKIDGPYLDDIHKREEQAYRNRTKKSKARPARKKSAKN